MIYPTLTTELADLQASILPAITTALVPIHSIAWKAAQHFSYGARGFMRVPVSEANDLNYLLCHCDETGDASRLGNNDLWPLNQIGLNSVTKNRTLIYPSQANLIKQRTAANAGMVLGFIWNKEEQGADADV
jgi:hypothetical protein